MTRSDHAAIIARYWAGESVFDLAQEFETSVYVILAVVGEI